LIDTSERLFLERGYDGTSIIDIIETAKIAKGTFYYHFGSKEELLDGVINKTIVGLEEELGRILEMKNKDPAEKLNEAINLILSTFVSRDKIINYLYDVKNAIWLNKLNAIAIFRLAPTIALIIGEGIKKGRFDTEYAEETAVLVVTTISFQYPIEFFEDRQRIERMLRAFEQALQRMLAVKDYHFAFQLKMDDLYCHN